MKHLYFIILIAISLQVNAQRNFKPGYIVTLNGDTLQGFIDVKQWDENPDNIMFKKTDQSVSVQYTPVNIQAFGVNQVEHYQRYAGPVTKGTVALADLSIGIDTSFVKDTIFLRILTGGKNVTLFSYNDRIKTRYFVAEKNSAPVELKRYVYLDNVQYTKVREYNLYVQQLLDIAAKIQPADKQITDKIIQSSYELSRLQDIIFRLNGQANHYAATIAPRNGYRFFIGTGANLTNARFSGEVFSGYRINIFSSGTNVQSAVPFISGGVDYYLNRNTHTFIFRAEGNLLMNNIVGNYSASYWDGVRQVGQEEKLTFNQMSVNINPQLIYNIYYKDNFQFYLAGGLQLSFSAFTNKHWYINNYFDGKLEDNFDKTLLYRNITSNLNTKAGLVLANSFDIYFGYYAPVAITNYPTFGINLSYYRVGINYFLGKKNQK